VFRNTAQIAQSFGSNCYKLEIPQLKVGTLDALMYLAEEVAKFDTHTDMALRRIVRAWTSDVSDDANPNKLSELVVPGDGGGDSPPQTALQHFRWAEERYPSKGALTDLAKTIYGSICELDEEVKTNLQNFNQVRSQLQTLQRKSGGNLLVKELHGVVDDKCYVQHQNGDLSDKISPIFVVIPKHKEEEFKEEYERWSKECVPMSYRFITSDESYVLARVLHLNCATLDSFKAKISDFKCTVREFTFDASAVEQNTDELNKLKEKEAELKKTARQTLHMAFGEVFINHMHLKAVRMFVESVLWYALPPNFQAMIISVNPRKEAGLQAKMDEVYADAKGPGASRGGGDGGEEGDRPYLQLEFELDYLTES